MTGWRVLTPDAQYPDDAEVERRTAGPGVRFITCRERDATRLPATEVAGCDGMLVWHGMPIDAGLVARLGRCRIIVRSGVGFDHIDLEACGAAGIPVCNTPDYGTSEVADHAIALTLALTRGICSYHDALRQDPAGQFVVQTAPLVRRLRGTRFGIVGLGRIGTATALRAKAFGFDVLAHDPYLPAGHEIAIGVTRLPTLQALLGAADIVSLHCPLTAETRHLIDAAALAAMRPHAILVNTARGAIIDIDALHAALRDDRIAGAGLDVLPQEPLPADHPLLADYHAGPGWLAHRLILTPHAAWYSPESRYDARRLATETLMGFLRTGALRNCVNMAFLRS